MQLKEKNIFLERKIKEIMKLPDISSQDRKTYLKENFPLSSDDNHQNKK